MDHGRHTALLDSVLGAIGNTPLVELSRITRAGWAHPWQAGISEPGLFEEGPHCSTNDRVKQKRRGTPARSNGCRADEWEHRHGIIDRLCGEGISVRGGYVERKLYQRLHDACPRRRGGAHRSIAGF